MIMQKCLNDVCTKRFNFFVKYSGKILLCACMCVCVRVCVCVCVREIVLLQETVCSAHKGDRERLVACVGIAVISSVMSFFASSVTHVYFSS